VNRARATPIIRCCAAPRANLIIKQGAEQKFLPTLYVENKSRLPAAEFEPVVRAALGKLSDKWPGVDVNPPPAISSKSPCRTNTAWITKPISPRPTESYLRYLGEGQLPAWEVPNMLAKYYVTTEAFRVSHEK